MKRLPGMKASGRDLAGNSNWKSSLRSSARWPTRISFKEFADAPGKFALRRFKKYAIYFAVKDNAFAVLSVFHASRKYPAELRRRLK